MQQEEPQIFELKNKKKFGNEKTNIETIISQSDHISTILKDSLSKQQQPIQPVIPSASVILEAKQRRQRMRESVEADYISLTGEDSWNKQDKIHFNNIKKKGLILYSITK